MTSRSEKSLKRLIRFGRSKSKGSYEYEEWKIVCSHCNKVLAKIEFESPVRVRNVFPESIWQAQLYAPRKMIALDICRTCANSEYWVKVGHREGETEGFKKGADYGSKKKFRQVLKDHAGDLTDVIDNIDDARDRASAILDGHLERIKEIENDS